MSIAEFKAGFVAIIGRPNVGKSTLLNHLLGQKIAITSRKPQTTRHKMLGVLSQADCQIAFVDTPGIHQNAIKNLNVRMNDAAKSALGEVDVILWLLDANKFTNDDAHILAMLTQTRLPVVLAVNKLDTMNKSTQLATLQNHSARYDFADIVPISALKNQNLDTLISVICRHLPIQAPIFDDDMLTDKSERFLASEIVREKIMRTVGDEIPYDLTVQIDGFRDEPRHFDQEAKKWRKACTFIDAIILVERAGQKAIIIGQKGERLKKISTDARLDMERLFDKKIMLRLWVKVREGWSDDVRQLASLGY